MFEYEDVLVTTVKQAALLAFHHRDEGMDAGLKAGDASQVLTKADTAISELFRLTFGDKLIEEETADSIVVDFRITLLNGAEIAVGDPIDGTSSYAGGMGTWGITLGIFQYGEPVAGIIYCPEIAAPYNHKVGLPPQGILVFAERGKGYWQMDGSDVKVPLSNAAPDLGLDSTGSFFWATYKMFRDYFPAPPIKPWHEHSCVSAILMMATGRLVGMFYKDSIWDNSGGMAIWAALGVEAVNIRTGKRLERLDAWNYDAKWGTPDGYLVCHPEVREELCKRLIGLDGKPLSIPTE